MINTLVLVVWVLVITVGRRHAAGGAASIRMFGQGIARILVIAPFFVMPTVSALIWKNMLMHPVNGCSPSSPSPWGCSRSTSSAAFR